MQQLSPERALSIVEDLARKSRGRLSPADVAAASGIAVHEAQDALERMMELYEARITLRQDTGDILFVFPLPLRKRGSKTFREIALQVRDALWKAFVIVYKAAIGVILIVYTVAFVVLLIAIAIAASQNRDRDSDDNNVSHLIGGIFRAIFEGMQFYAWNRALTYGYDSDGLRYRRYDTGEKKKNFIKSVYDFVFGPDRPPHDPLADAREAAAFIRTNRGKMAAGHLIALAGWTYDKAEEKLADYLVRFKGHPELSDSGIVVGEFEDFMRREDATLKGGAIVLYQDETEAPYERTGNTGGRNFAIAAMNIFNLGMSVAIISGGLLPTDNMLVLILLGWFPFVFSLLFFAIPLIRIPIITKKERERHRNNIRKKIVGVITSQPERSFTFADIIMFGGINKENEQLARQVLDKVVVELSGDTQLDENGTVHFVFPRLAQELKAASLRG